MDLKIEKSEIPESTYDIGCRVLDECLRRLFDNPKVREDYQNWKNKGGN